MPEKVLVTGATGFVGRVLVRSLVGTDNSITVAVRGESVSSSKKVKPCFITSISAETDWTEALQSVTVVVHLAGRAHVMNDDVSDPLSTFREVNTAGTIKLARDAAEAGVRRFVFISSVKVNGGMTEDVSFSEGDECIPTDPYGLSKYEAEQCLLKLAKETDIEVVIIRPPLVYGPGVRANFALMMRWVNKRVPLPLGGVHNRRSLVGIDNLVSFINLCIEHPKAANEIFLISDGEDVSTTELLDKLANAFGKRSLLLPIPVRLMTFAAKLVGKADVANRLFGSLQVDSSKARELLGWKPVITMDEQLKKTAETYLNEKTV